MLFAMVRGTQFADVTGLAVLRFGTVSGNGVRICGVADDSSRSRSKGRLGSAGAGWQAPGYGGLG